MRDTLIATPSHLHTMSSKKPQPNNKSAGKSASRRNGRTRKSDGRPIEEKSAPCKDDATVESDQGVTDRMTRWGEVPDSPYGLIAQKIDREIAGVHEVLRRLKTDPPDDLVSDLMHYAARSSNYNKRTSAIDFVTSLSAWMASKILNGIRQRIGAREFTKWLRKSGVASEISDSRIRAYTELARDLLETDDSWVRLMGGDVLVCHALSTCGVYGPPCPTERCKGSVDRALHLKGVHSGLYECLRWFVLSGRTLEEDDLAQLDRWADEMVQFRRNLLDHAAQTPHTPPLISEYTAAIAFPPR